MPGISVEHDGQSLDHFARRHGLELTRLAYLVTGDRTLAGDLVQEVLSAMRGRLGDRPELELSLARAQRAVVNADIGHRSSSRPLTGADPDPGSGDELWQLLAGLPHRRRVVLVMRYHLGLGDGGIAETLGCRRGTVRGLASRALADLRTSATVSLISPSEDGTGGWVPQGDDLERRLAELFGQRAATVTRARHVDLGSGVSNRTVAAPGPARFGRLGKNVALLAAIALVVMVAGAGAGAGLATLARQHGKAPDTHAATGAPHPVTKPTATSISPRGTKPNATSTPPQGTEPTSSPRLRWAKEPCMAVAPTSWRQAIAAGAVPVDHGSNEVLSFNSATGDYLVRQGNQAPRQGPPVYEDVELALFHGAVGRAIFSGGISDVPRASMTGAISADWVTFSVASSLDFDLGYTFGNLSRTVMLYERASGKSIALAKVTGEHLIQGKAFIGSPVIAAGKVYWLSGQGDNTTLESWDLALGSKDDSVPAANAIGLISYGGGVVIRHDGRLSQGPGTPLSSDVLAVLPQGDFWGIYNFDGDNTLTWLRDELTSTWHASLDIGNATVTYRNPLRIPTVLQVVGFPFLGVNGAGSSGDPRKGLLDLRADSQVTLPAGLSLQAVVGSTAVFGTGGLAGWGSAGLSLVPVSALPPVRC